MKSKQTFLFYFHNKLITKILLSYYRNLLEKCKSLQESFNHEVKTRNRLSLHNEQLLWKLKQNSEKFSNALTELSKIHPGQSDLLNDTKLSLYGEENSQSDVLNCSGTTEKVNDCFHIDSISPPMSPVIKGVVEKCDSVSWVLEINDEESGEALASRMVRRAGSFRSSFNEKHSNSYLSPINYSNRSVNALSQSASATSIILRQHSTDIFPLNSPQQTSTPTLTGSSRTRSQSVSKSEPKMIIRSNSSAAASSRKTDAVVSSWNERCSSKRLRNNPSSSIIAKDTKNIDNLDITEDGSNNISLNKKLIKNCELRSNNKLTEKNRSRSNSIDENCDAGESSYMSLRRNPIKFKTNKRGLITCNMVALTSQRPELLCPSTQTYPSVQDLKNCQQIKESAGEAMVSGTNSEDEDSSSASSDSLLSAGSSHASPMEISWSDDIYPNESIV